MPELENLLQLDEDEFKRFDEAQSFLQLLADMLNRLVTEQNEQEDNPAEVAEETAG